MFYRIFGKFKPDGFKSLVRMRTCLAGGAFLLAKYKTTQCTESPKSEAVNSHALFHKVQDSIFIVKDQKGHHMAIGVYVDGYIVAYFVDSNHIEALKHKTIQAFASPLISGNDEDTLSLQIAAIKEDENLILFVPRTLSVLSSPSGIYLRPKLADKLLLIALDRNSDLNISENMVCQVEKLSDVVDFPATRLCEPNTSIKAFQAAFDFSGDFAGITVPDSNLMIPAKHITALIDSYKQHQRFERAYLGISMMATSLENKEKGMLVTNVLNSSPAANAGLQMGDIILEINSWKTPSAEHVFKALGYQKGRALRILVRSQGQLKIVDVVI